MKSVLAEILGANMYINKQNGKDPSTIYKTRDSHKLMARDSTQKR